MTEPDPNEEFTPEKNLAELSFIEIEAYRLLKILDQRLKAGERQIEVGAIRDTVLMIYDHLEHHNHEAARAFGLTSPLKAEYEDEDACSEGGVPHEDAAVRALRTFDDAALVQLVAGLLDELCERGNRIVVDEIAHDNPDAAQRRVGTMAATAARPEVGGAMTLMVSFQGDPPAGQTELDMH